MLTIEMFGDVRNTDTALRALSLFSGDTPDNRDLSAGILADTQKLIARLPKNPNRNVILWMLDVILEIAAPVSWWAQIDQYDVHVFPLRRQDRNPDRLLSEQDFDGAISKETLSILNNYIRDGQPELALNLLPTNFIQHGYLKISHKSLSDIYRAEASSTEDPWRRFCEFIESLPYHEMITEIS